jgi:hypothetical protein
MKRARAEGLEFRVVGTYYSTHNATSSTEELRAYLATLLPVDPSTGKLEIFGKSLSRVWQPGLSVAVYR